MRMFQKYATFVVVLIFPLICISSVVVGQDTNLGDLQRAPGFQQYPSFEFPNKKLWGALGGNKSYLSDLFDLSDSSVYENNPIARTKPMERQLMLDPNLWSRSLPKNFPEPSLQEMSQCQPICFDKNGKIICFTICGSDRAATLRQNDHLRSLSRAPTIQRFSSFNFPNEKLWGVLDGNETYLTDLLKRSDGLMHQDNPKSKGAIVEHEFLFDPSLLNRDPSKEYSSCQPTCIKQRTKITCFTTCGTERRF